MDSMYGSMYVIYVCMYVLLLKSNCGHVIGFCSVVPFRLATQFPDLVNIEMSRLSPISYSFQTSVLAEAITCGILTHTGTWSVCMVMYICMYAPSSLCMHVCMYVFSLGG